MYTIIAKTKGLPRDEWLSLRRLGIGGSDAGAICGVNPYANAMSVYVDKVNGDNDDEDNESMRIGRDLEDYVARRFAEETGLKVRRSNVMYRSVEHPFMIANVDRLIVGEDAGLECKTASAYGADKWKDGTIPLHYVLQCLHYMIVTGKRTWYIAALILGKEFVFRRIEYDEALAMHLWQIEEDFWTNNVMKQREPDPDGSKIYDDILQKYFKASKKESQIPLIGFDEKLEKREQIMSEIERLQTERKKIEQEVKLFMKEHEAAKSDQYLVRWSSIESKRIDAKKLREEMPEVYEKYAKESLSRRFEVKAA